MKVYTHKKLGLFVVLLASFQTANCAQAPSELIQVSSALAQAPSEFDNREKYDYKESEVIVTLEPGESTPGDTNGPVILEDKIVSDYLTTKKVRTLISQETKNGQTIRTTKEWTTRNPSYFTWANMGLGAAVIGAGVAAYASGLNIDDMQKFSKNAQSNVKDATVNLGKNVASQVNKVASNFTFGSSNKTSIVSNGAATSGLAEQSPSEEQSESNNDAANTSDNTMVSDANASSQAAGFLDKYAPAIPQFVNNVKTNANAAAGFFNQEANKAADAENRLMPQAQDSTIVNNTTN